MSNRTIIIIAGVCLVLLCICVIIVIALTVFGVFKITSPAADQGDAFMKSLQSGNYSAAFDLCSPTLQKELGNSERLREMIESQNMQPKSWTFSSRNVENNRGTLTGTFVASQECTLDIRLIKIGDVWKINAFEFKY